MKETRPSKYGKNLAIWIKNSIPKEQAEDYIPKFLEELKTYSFEPRKKGQPKNSGCIHELEDLTEVDINNPKDLAKLVKEGVHLMYQKQTSNKVITSILKSLCPK